MLFDLPPSLSAVFLGYLSLFFFFSLYFSFFLFFLLLLCFVSFTIVTQLTLNYTIPSGNMGTQKKDENCFPLKIN
jgi:hypothetical protein